MIKHDYKPQNSKRIFQKGLFDRLPAWATHPYLIFSTAIFILMLAILLSKQDSTPQNAGAIEIAESDSSSATSDSGELELSIGSAPELNDEVASSVTNHLEKSNNESNYSDPIEIPLQLDSLTSVENELASLDTEQKWLSEPVKKGDNLSKIFKRIGFSPQLLYKVVNLDENTALLKNLKPGEVIHYQLDPKNQLTALKYVMDLQNTLFINRLSQSDQSSHDYASNIVNKTIEVRTAYVSGTITDSLYMSGKRAGLTDTLVVNLANIFDWDIDFILDIRAGDTFAVLFEEKFLDGEMIGNGDIIAAEFINQGDSYKAVRYKDSKDNINYYTPEGLSMRKAFLRAPIKFSYISSGFKLRRFHPILKRWKAHRGIDYRAKTGTPIRAAGDGKVTHSSSNQYNGKYVFIQHGQGIVTKYLHMSRRAVSRGKRVKQGQVIGYVGATGLAEAPHLHYEFLVNGVHRNPRTVKLPKAEPISSNEKDNFLIASRTLINQLEARKNIQSNSQVAR